MKFRRERMRIDIVTLFPQLVEPLTRGSIIGRAQAKGLADIAVVDLRVYVPDGERADDAPYGGGAGMVMRLGPLVACLDDLLGDTLSVPDGTRIIVPTPAGAVFTQAMARDLSSLQRLILICGHYEGIDERLFDIVAASEVSLGDFVLTGGEIPALAIADACVRILPGAIAAESAANDSFCGDGLDWPHYTRPATFRGVSVPEILLSGDHGKIALWRADRARERTSKRRPDLRS
ncbi:MAG TPA: tRNA (guanosine(37)-N1)-methyltransferase TrmD [Candidatus Eremiobacteraceae bacterium]|nr:tRNA (guanosine(37)-N1)-methyltransferase TrmD [Candidatus Eremiobacteraceae bacterium]